MNIFASQSDKIEERELRHAALSRELAAFGKTALLAPGEHSIMELLFPVKDMASYSAEDAA